MRVSSTRTARFAAIVKECGKPEVVSLWGPPSAEFLRAAKQDRVMTVKQETVGAKADFGVVGFLQEKNVSYLLFPKPLARFKDARVIGIKYDLVESGAGLAGYSKPDKARPAARELKNHPKPEPPPKATKQPKPGKPTKGLSERAPYHQKGAKPEKPSKPEPRFEVTVRFTAEADITTVVQAKNQALARRLGEEMVMPPDMAKVRVKKKVLKAKKQR